MLPGFTIGFLGRGALVAIAALAAASTWFQPARPLESPLPQTSIASEPEVRLDPATGLASTEISVLTYNVAALPWPLRGDRTKALELIGAELADARAAGYEPDVVLLQEGFRASTSHLIELSGYPNWVRGPARNEQMPAYSGEAPERFRNERRWDRAEGLGKVADSGLYILSNWPILRKETTPFYASECAGYDCAANKGVLWAEIEVPGMPGVLQVYNTHLNARTSTGVPEARSLAAYALQVARMETFVDNHRDGDEPLIYGGDFNAKGSPERFDVFARAERLPQRIVQKDCLAPGPDCAISVPSGSGRPWLDTQDWQGWAHGQDVRIRVTGIETWFAGERPDAPLIKGRRTLSDHDGLLVRYELSWPSRPSDTLIALAEPVRTRPQR